MIRVAWQGERGAYSELAVRQHFGSEYQAVCCRRLEDVLNALLNDEADYAVVPLENSIAGPVPGADKVAQHPDVAVINEFWVPIHHCLLTTKGTRIELLRTVISHPIALAQCTKFFARNPHLKATEWYDTAGAAQHVAHLRDVSLAAIASEAAAEAYGLVILARDIADSADNRTHFAVLERRAG